MTRRSADQGVRAVCQGRPQRLSGPPQLCQGRAVTVRPSQPRADPVPDVRPSARPPRSGRGAAPARWSARGTWSRWSRRDRDGGPPRSRSPAAISPGSITRRYAPGRARCVNVLIQPCSPSQPANVRHGMRGVDTSSTTWSPTRQRSPIRALVTSTPDRGQVLAEHAGPQTPGPAQRPRRRGPRGRTRTPPDPVRRDGARRRSSSPATPLSRRLRPAHQDRAVMRALVDSGDVDVRMQSRAGARQC